MPICSSYRTRRAGSNNAKINLEIPPKVVENGQKVTKSEQKWPKMELIAKQSQS